MSMSVEEFRGRLREEMALVASEVGWNLGSPVERGQIFQLWLARLICNAEGLDADPDEALLLSRDLKADVVLEDEDNQRLIICQTKYVKARTAVDETEVSDFFDRHSHFMSADWVRKHGGEHAAIALGGYAERIENNWQMDFRFVTTGDASPRVHELAENKSRQYEDNGIPVSCSLMDFSVLKEYYVSVTTLEQEIPDVVELTLPEERWILKQSPHQSLVAVLKGNALRDLKKRYKESLYAWNIRGFLGGQGINKAISETVRDQPESFFYFNNGVSAICTSFELDGNRLTAKSFQIVNGAQTVSSLAAQDASPEVEVLFRLTKTDSVNTDSGFNHDLIRFNNSQNPIKVSDFRSNDQIQLYLENAFSNRKATPGLKKVRYLRKRTVAGTKGLGSSLKLEDLAKVRYAFFHEPTLVHASPRSLWTLEGSDAAYSKSFGIDGELKDSWSKSEFDETCLAIALYFKIADDARERKDDSPFLFRLRFHALALGAAYWRDEWSDGSPKEILGKSELFTSLWDGFAADARRVMTAEWLRAEEDSTLFAFVRSTAVWETLKKQFHGALKAR